MHRLIARHRYEYSEWLRRLLNVQDAVTARETFGSSRVSNAVDEISSRLLESKRSSAVGNRRLLCWSFHTFRVLLYPACEIYIIGNDNRFCHELLGRRQFLAETNGMPRACNYVQFCKRLCMQLWVWRWTFLFSECMHWRKLRKHDISWIKTHTIRCLYDEQSCRHRSAW